MNRTLAQCMFVAIAAGMAAAIAGFAAGWGWIAALALYSGVGSMALVAAACLRASVPERAPIARRRAEEDPAFA